MEASLTLIEAPPTARSRAARSMKPAVYGKSYALQVFRWRPSMGRLLVAVRDEFLNWLVTAA